MFRTRFGQAVLLLHAIAFLMVGVTGLRDPQALMTPLEVELGSVSGYNEIRAGYGGSHLMLAVLFIASMISKRLRFTGLLVLTVFVSGLVLGRVVSFAFDGLPNGFVWRLFAFEVAGAIAGAIALVLHRGRPRPSLYAGDL